MNIALFLFSNIVLLMSAWLTSVRVLGFRDGVDRVLGAFVCGSFLVVASLEILSAFSAITFENALIFQVVILVALLILTGRRKREAADFGIAGAGAGKGKPVSPGAGFYVTLAVFAGVFLLGMAMSLTSPPAPTDAFLDHLVFPAEWLHAGRISMVQTLSPDQATTYYPSNAELIYLWLMLPLHDDLATGLLEPLALLACMAAAVRMGRRLGMNAAWAAGAAALAALAPGVNEMMRHFGVDLFFGAGALCAAAFLLPNEDGKLTVPELAAAGLAAGLAVGAKYVGVVTLAVMFPLVFAGRTGLGKIANAAVFAAAAAAAGGFWYIRNLAETGSAFYPMGLDLSGIHIMTGAFERAAMFNAYLHIPTSELGTFKEILVDLVFGPYLIAALGTVFAIAGARKGTLGGQLGIAALCALAAGVIAAASSGAEIPPGIAEAIPAAGAALLVISFYFVFPDTRWWQVYALSLGPLLFAAHWYINPYNTPNNYRFLVPAVFALCIGAVMAAERRKWRWCWWVLGAAALAVNLEEAARLAGFFLSAARMAGESGWHLAALKTAVPAAAAAFFICVAFAALTKKSYPGTVVLSVLAMCFFATLLFFKAEQMETGRYQWYSSHYWGDGWAALARIKEPVTVAYAGNCSPYALYGNRLKNTVEYVNVDGAPEDKIFHDYEIEQRKNSPPPDSSVGLNYIFRGAPDYEAWHAELLRRDVDVLFLTREFYRGAVTDPQELTWAVENPAAFKLLAHRGDTYIFATNKNGGGGSAEKQKSN